jgi:putative toxin-antitoxin system antitoxin component (TIGR02293 family)
MENKKSKPAKLEKTSSAKVAELETLEPLDKIAIGDAYLKSIGINANAQNDFELVNYIKKGVQKNVLEKTMAKTGLSIEEMASILHTTDRTLRRYKSKTILNPEQSERLVELGVLYSRGQELFGSLDLFKTWMESDLVALSGNNPKQFLDTSLGIQLLLQLLGRIEYGIYS